MLEGSFGCAFFYAGQYALREQELPVGVQGHFEGFYRGWDSQDCEIVLATAGTTPLLVELIGVAA